MWGGRDLTAVLGAIAVTCALAAAPADARPAGVGKDGRPNILVVMTDDMTQSDLAFMPKTRRLLAKQGPASRTPSPRSRSAAHPARPSSPGNTRTTTASPGTSIPRAGTGWRGATRRSQPGSTGPVIAPD